MESWNVIGIGDGDDGGELRRHREIVGVANTHYCLIICEEEMYRRLDTEQQQYSEQNNWTFIGECIGGINTQNTWN